ncbi:PP0621 family protein [Duganella sp. HH105]|uniref:PP0621 family protein n=1 Tax=Duganella sp. HH105 TaxID=1781067 RepID=UPI000877DB76|nr:PP0621 family protein [Duganella sp. HH105]OEZ58929.1 hypothetical protein DUGA6_38660 [Duganella sp. HH105]
MSRIIFWLALVFLVIFAVRSKIREAQKRHQQQFRQPQQPPEGGRAAAKSVADAETMLQCAHCGIFYPASETVQARGRDYCSAAHATLPAA